ncbi:MAG: dienelactone hydrolase family protein [Pseudomonadota bacterium]
MSLTTQSIDYTLDGKDFEGLLAIDDSQSGERPVVLISHAWAGRSSVENAYAEKVAELGYAGFALDLYGKGVLGQSTEENQALMTPFAEDRPMLQARLNAIIDLVQGLDKVDASKVIFMGFCFGGLCALDVARSGRDIAGCASFHGLLGAPGNTDANTISAKVIAFHGFDDPMASPEDLVAFGQEMTKADADWQAVAYGQTMHAFTNPAANDPSFGTVYNETAALRAWDSFRTFATECFAN